MENEVVREDGDVTQRRAWSAAEAAAHPALGIRPGKSAAPLARVPRASVAPPPPFPGRPRVVSRVASPPAAETVITPAPRFDDEAQAEDSLDDLIELSSQMLIEEPDLDAPSLDDDEVELLADDLLQEVDDSMEVGDSEVLEEVDSGLLAYVETRGEFTDRPRRAPSAPEVSTVSLASLAESLHTQALASGMATYSNGVPTHALDHGPANQKTLPIRRVVESSKTRTSPAVRNGLFGAVFLAGIGAGVFFGMPSTTTTTTTTTTAASGTTVAATAPGAAAIVIPAGDISETAAAAAVAAPDERPVVEPLVVEPATDDVLAATDETAAEPDAPIAEPDEALGDIDVRPLEDGAVATETSKPEITVETSEPAPTLKPAKVVAPAKKARTKATTEVPPRDVAVTGNADPGVLMLGAKPPCEIQIDGKDTGLSTPQRVLRLPPGKHKVTLVNHEHNLRETFRVSIRSGRKTRIVRDMTSKIK